MTFNSRPEEEKLVETPENHEVGSALIKAYIAGDKEEYDRLIKKLIVPSSLLKALGKDFVKSKGMSTITCEAVGDTEWLK